MAEAATRSGVSLPFYMAGHANAGGPGLLLFTPVFGIDGDAIEMAHRWAARGFRVAVPDVYWRVMPGPLDRSEEGRARAMARWKQLDVDGVMEDLRPLADSLRTHPLGNGRLAAIGFCAGGELAFLAATRYGAEAVAGFHATRVHTHLDELARAKGAISLHYGDSDSLVPMNEVDEVRAALAGRSNAAVHVYEGAPHGFSFKDRPSYHEQAATRSQAEALRVLEALK